MPCRVRFHAAIPPEAPLPMTMTEWTFGDRMICMDGAAVTG